MSVAACTAKSASLGLKAGLSDDVANFNGIKESHFIRVPSVWSVPFDKHKERVLWRGEVN